MGVGPRTVCGVVNAHIRLLAVSFVSHSRRCILLAARRKIRNYYLGTGVVGIMVCFAGGVVVTFSVFGGGFVVTFLVTFAIGFATLAQNGPWRPLFLQAAQQCAPPLLVLSTCRSYGHPLRSHITVVLFTLAQYGPCSPLLLHAAQQCVPPLLALFTCRSNAQPARSHIILRITK